MKRVGDLAYKGWIQVIIKHNNKYYAMDVFEYLSAINEIRTFGDLNKDSHYPRFSLEEAKRDALLMADVMYMERELKLSEDEIGNSVDKKDYNLNDYDIKETTRTIGAVGEESIIPMWIVSDKTTSEAAGADFSGLTPEDEVE